MMRVMVLVKPSENADKDFEPTPWAIEMMEAMGRFNDELRIAGVLLMADGLKPSSYGKRITFDGAKRTVIDGPFSETRQLVAGFWLWEVKDMDEAVAWVKRCPNPMPGPSDIEIRPLFEMADINPDTSFTLTITRTFSAPRARVFDAWNPKSNIGWWGPKDFTLLFNEGDLKSGERWRTGMVRNGHKFVSGGIYREVVPPARLAMTHAWENDDGQLGPQTLLTILLEEHNGKTEMVLVQTGFEDAASRDDHSKGWNEAFDALADKLARTVAASD